VPAPGGPTGLTNRRLMLKKRALNLQPLRVTWDQPRRNRDAIHSVDTARNEQITYAAPNSLRTRCMMHSHATPRRFANDIFYDINA
jgi:hypothetical protein